MVNDLVSYNRILKVAESQGLSPDTIQQLKNLRTPVLMSRRKTSPRAKCPDGGISINEASRKYNVPTPTICRWISQGWIPVLARHWETFIAQDRIAKLAEVYHGDKRQGSWAVKRFIESEK